MDATSEPSSSRPTSSSPNPALVALLLSMMSSSLSSRSRGGSASLTTEVIPSIGSDDDALGNRPGNVTDRLPIPEPQQSASALPELFSALLSLISSDSPPVRSNSEALPDIDQVQPPNPTNIFQGADDLFFPTSSRSLPPHPVFVQVHERLRRSGPPPPTSPHVSDSEATVTDENECLSDRAVYPRNLPSYHSDEDFCRYWQVPLEMQTGRRNFCLDFIDLRDGVSMEQVKNMDRLAVLLQSEPPIRFIRLGPRKTSSKALQMIFTKYEVSPHFLDTFGFESSPGELGGLGVGVRTKLLFSETEPLEVRGYHLWYKLPYRRSGAFPDLHERLVEETPSRGLILRKTNHAVAAAEIRPYMTYNTITKSSSTVIYTPHADSYLKPALTENFSQSERLDMHEDPFGIHLVHLLEVAVHWKIALWITSMELSILENEALKASDAHIMPLTRTFHTISIHIARWHSELQVTIDIVAGLGHAHDHFYETVMKQLDRCSRPPVYQRLQCAFQNSRTAMKAHLVCVTEFEDRIRNSTSLLFHIIKDRSSRQLLAVTNNMASTNDAIKQIAEQGHESGEFMAEIAKAARKDGYAMKSIAIMTMCYLPGAFVTSVFGMQLVRLQGDPGHETLSFARPWPIYITVMIILTLATFGVWVGWMWWAERMPKNKGTHKQHA